MPENMGLHGIFDRSWVGARPCKIFGSIGNACKMATSEGRKLAKAQLRHPAWFNCRFGSGLAIRGVSGELQIRVDNRPTTAATTVCLKPSIDPNRPFRNRPTADESAAHQNV